MASTLLVCCSTEMKTILKAIEVDSPVHRVYKQWTRFEDFPRFMQGVKRVILLDDQRLQWETEFSGATKEWFATITDLTPDQRIAWESEDGDYVAGVVTFEPIGTGRTRVNLKLFYDNKGAPAAEADSLSSIANHVEEDLQDFRNSWRSGRVLIGSDEFQDEHYSESPYRCTFHRPDPGPGPTPEPDPPQPPHPFPNPPIPPKQPVLTRLSSVNYL
jgi:uncharacterized protein YndB with AHSA1/START domain